MLEVEVVDMPTLTEQKVHLREQVVFDHVREGLVNGVGQIKPLPAGGWPTARLRVRDRPAPTAVRDRSLRRRVAREHA